MGPPKSKHQMAPWMRHVDEVSRLAQLLAPLVMGSGLGGTANIQGQGLRKTTRNADIHCGLSQQRWLACVRVTWCFCTWLMPGIAPATPITTWDEAPALAWTGLGEAGARGVKGRCLDGTCASAHATIMAVGITQSGHRGTFHYSAWVSFIVEHNRLVL